MIIDNLRPPVLQWLELPASIAGPRRLNIALAGHIGEIRADLLTALPTLATLPYWSALQSESVSMVSAPRPIPPATPANRAAPKGDMEATVRFLEEEIVLGNLHPRERLTEDDLLERFELKRHVVRQVLAELEAMGLVERRRNTGAIVREHSVKEVEDLYAVRELLECECARLIRLPISDARLEALTHIQHGHDAMVRAGNLRGIFRANMMFHRELFQISDNQVLVEATQQHALRAHGIRSSSLLDPSLVERARREHWQMLEALQRADGDGLVELCRVHLRPSLETYVATHLRRAQQSG